MSSPISLAQARKDRAARGQMSLAKAFGARRVRVIPVVDKPGFVAWWAWLLRQPHTCGGDAVVIAQTFGCTEQAARYWLDAFSCPKGQYFDLAMALWPEDFLARHAPDLRKAA